jgi:alpha-glucosidase
MGFHVVTIVDPGIKVEKGYKQYDEGVQKGYFATYPNGDFYTGTVWPGPCHFPDFYRPEVRKWWGESFSALTEKGIEGFWNDMNEPSAWGQNIPDLIQFGAKGKQMTLREARNGYGLQMSRATYEGTQDILGRRAFVLTRAAYAGIQRYSAVWTGDNASSDTHMLLGQRLVNSLGLSGVSYTGVDIGGFIGNPSAELMMRWNSLGVYTPMFRNHSEINAPMREPWRFGPEAEAVMRKDIEQRYRLLPYIYSAFYKSTQSGLPVARSLAIEYTTDAEVYKEANQNEFLFGDNILVAPVESNKTSTSVYLPAGDWYRLSSDVSYAGNSTIDAAAPLSDLPVFVKAGGIIPMQQVLQNTSEKGDGILSMHIWNGKKGSSYVYYEDDGSSFDNEKGNYYKRNISFAPVQKQVSLSMVQGSFTSRFNTLKLVLHGFSKDLKSIKVNGKTMKLSSNEKGNLIAEITNRQEVITIKY